VTPETITMQEKLRTLAGYLDELASVARVSEREYLDSPMPRRAAERLMQVCVDAVGDIADLVLRELREETPATARESLAKLGQLGILQDPLAERLMGFVGLRNRLVHQYDRIDDARLHAGLHSFIRRCREYVSATSEWLSDHQEQGRQT
jgi:uncharacterized protein YutE (UPF0331/DUF86 family)